MGKAGVLSLDTLGLKSAASEGISIFTDVVFVSSGVGEPADSVDETVGVEIAPVPECDKLGAASAFDVVDEFDGDELDDDELDDELDDESDPGWLGCPGGAAAAVPAPEATAAPIPNATASPPIRPMYAAAPMRIWLLPAGPIGKHLDEIGPQEARRGALVTPGTSIARASRVQHHRHRNSAWRSGIRTAQQRAGVGRRGTLELLASDRWWEGDQMPPDSRVPLLPIEEAKAAADEAGVPDYMADLAIFQMLLNHPTLARAINDLLATMLWHGSLDTRLRELAIMRIGWLTGSDYEWTQHWRVALRLGVTEEDLLGVRNWQQHNAFGPPERAMLGAVDDVVSDGAVSSERWAACVRDISSDPAVLVELVTAIGAWRMIASILRSLEVPLEDDVESWPPDGQPPSSA